MTIKVLLVDDERLIRAGLAAIINAEDDLAVVGEASDGSEVPGAVHRLRPDVILMDVRMPRLDGIQATRRILDTVAEPPRIIVVTTFENDEYVYDAGKRARLPAQADAAGGDPAGDPDGRARRQPAVPGGDPGAGRPPRAVRRRGGARWHGQLTEREGTCCG